MSKYNEATCEFGFCLLLLLLLIIIIIIVVAIVVNIISYS